ncbi:Response regulator receiver domain-containing protein [Cribrihabitans marinus]|uniref:Response regulator receiver domain-containing protein n=1 Tax=Cribrihabitans marinus TaxID=1227549 RepID=A0A1H7DT76_9RHOB|nr:response regulator [Cribrihabitans marinus]GGH39636.1 hypothetical protein GCM10010973_35580 [Cribrihabitans marinus]SEK04057.1 Response regulator receiver domain-containing protein [Cribrihabitans marinus]
MRLLAVDDDASILELLKHILSAFGYDDVTTARSGPDALAIIAQAERPFDCLLLDVQMPEMNGITLCEEIRTLPDYQFTPIIMLTAMVQKHYIDEAFEVGASDYVTKPFDFEDLKQRLSDAHRMAAERRASIEAVTGMDETACLATDFPSLVSNGPVPAKGMAGFFGLPEFENYAFQISTTHPLTSSVVAVKAENLDKTLGAGDLDGARQFVSSVGTALLDSSQAMCRFVSYWGNGVFVLTREAGKALDANALADELKQRSAAARGASNGAVRAVGFRVGEEVALNAGTKLEAIYLIEKTVESVEEPAAEPLAV